MIFAASTAFVLLTLAHDLKEFRGEEEVAGETNGSPHHLSVLSFKQLQGHIFTGKSQLPIHTWSEFQKWLPLTTVELRASSTTHKSSVTSIVSLRDMTKEKDRKYNTVKDKGWRKFQDWSTMHSVTFLPMMQSPGHRHYVCAYHKETCLEILRPVTLQRRRLTLFSRMVRKPSTELGSKNHRF